MGKQRVIGESNPFDFPPCEFNEIIYSCREPFVEVIRGKLDEVPNNKFVAKMLPQTVDMAIAESAEQYIFMESLFEAGGSSELNIRPVHIMALGSPGFFARPTDKEWKTYEASNGVWTRTTLKAFMKAAAGADTLPEASNEGSNEGFFLARGVAEGDRAAEGNVPSSSSDNSGCNTGYKPQHEGSAQNEYGVSNRYREDLFLFTKNNADCKSFQDRLQDEENRSPDPKVMVASAECKDESGCIVDGLFQAGGCARAGVVRNIENGHGNPVYLLCLGLTKWYYGVLVIDGLVQVSRTAEGENSISEEDYRKYTETCKTTKTENVLSPDALNKLLKARLKMLVKYNKEIRSFPSQKYVVGKLYLPEDDSCWLELPSSLKEGKLIRQDARVFYEGLLRLVIGESVLDWTPNRLCAAKLIRLAIIHEKGKKAGAHMEVSTATRTKFSWYVQSSTPREVVKAQFLEMLEKVRSLYGDDEVRKLLEPSPSGTISGTATGIQQLETAQQHVKVEVTSGVTVDHPVKVEQPDIDVVTNDQPVVIPAKRISGSASASSARKKTKSQPRRSGTASGALQ